MRVVPSSSIINHHLQIAMKDPLDDSSCSSDDEVPLPPDLAKAFGSVVARILGDHYQPPKEDLKALVFEPREEFTDWIAEVLAEGRYLRMTSGAIWEVASADRTVVRGWLPHDEVLIWRDDQSATHPYEVMQLAFGEVVEAGLVRA